MAIKTLTRDESAERSTTTEGKIVHVTRTVKPKSDSEVRYVVEWNIDFDGVTNQELLQLAARGVVIDIQRLFRAASDKERESFGKRNFSVRELLDTTRERKTADPATRAKNAVAKLSDEEKAALIADLQKSLK